MTIEKRIGLHVSFLLCLPKYLYRAANSAGTCILEQENQIRKMRRQEYDAQPMSMRQVKMPFDLNRLAALCMIMIGMVTGLLAQTENFTEQDTLRGSITPDRAWWDLVHYDLEVQVFPQTRRLRGTNRITYRVLEGRQRMQIDLQEPMNITRVMQGGTPLAYERNGNAFFITLELPQQVGDLQQLQIDYEGEPLVSLTPPWTGGVTWEKDEFGTDFIATTCQGDGASLWWPCKDHMYDEPDSMALHLTVPAHLVGVANGRLRNVTEQDSLTKTYHWYVTNPISNYVVNINIGDYGTYSEEYEGEKGTLDCTYYVLKQDMEKAKTHFQQVPMMLEAFEHWFGPYPFYEDSYKLVQVPYLGMEHQSSVTYGNGFQNGYLGADLSGTGWGLKFDYLIIHESGHEWFANNITYRDIADMWIHEGFTSYSESLFLEFHYGKEAAEAYVVGTRKNIQNKSPIIGTYGVNHRGSGDMYYKGANMIHTLRQLVDDDEAWRTILRDMNAEFYHQTVTTQQIEGFLSERTGLDLQLFFDQYLRSTRVPTLEWSIKKRRYSYRWTHCVEGFDMPVKVMMGENSVWLQPSESWKHKKMPRGVSRVMIDRNFLVVGKKGSV